jgi:hypothetical protein
MTGPEPQQLRPTWILLAFFAVVVGIGIVTVLVPGLRDDPDAEIADEATAAPPADVSSTD